MECRLFHKEIAAGIFRISDSLHGPNEDGFSDLPGAATQNSYLVIGSEKAALIDLAVDTPELYSYACALANKPVQVLLTHGHPDHVYHLDTVSEAWLHSADHSMVRDGIPGIAAPVESVLLHPLADGQRVNLGDRELRVIALSGHTLGSVLFLDEKTRTLLTGDTCARRLLYGLTPTVPLEEHCRQLERLNELDFSILYTAHDRCGLPKKYLQTILTGIRDELPKTTDTVELPGIGAMRNLHWGDETTLSYFDMAISERYLPEHQTLQVTHLRVLHRENPIGIDETPEFSWMLCSRERNVTQQAYRILVRTQQETVWDSGYTMSDQQHFVAYGGKSLADRTRYFWQVTVWDCFGNAGCAEGFFETALLESTSWTAQWVESVMDCPTIPMPPFWPVRPPVRFQKQFLVDGEICKARLYATAHGVYRVFLNEERPDDREFAPEHTVYDKILYYQVYPVEALLRQGRNTLSFLVADGWYFCPQTRQEITEDSGKPAILYQLEIEYRDGRVQTICSDGTESSSVGTCEYADLFLGEKQDNCRSAGIQQPVVVRQFSIDPLCAQPMEPVRPVALLPAKEVYRSPKGEWIVDFGQILCGRARILVNAPRGTELTFEYFEVTDREGNYRNTMIAPQKDIYISDGVERLYEAAFTFHGFRYIRISGLEDIRKEDFTAVVLSSAKDNLGEFSCSDSRLNRLYQNIRWSQRNNMLSIPTDCPTREKGGFTGDIQIYAQTAMLNEEMTPFLSSWLRNLSAAQASNGSVPITVPETAPYKRLMIANAHDFGDTYPVGVAGWSDAAVIVPYIMYWMTGNQSILEQQYDSMTKWCSYVITTAQQKRGNPNLPKEVDRYLWNTGFHFGEWLIPSDKKGISQREACEGSAYYIAPIFGYLSVRIMAEIARILEKPEVEFYADTAGKMKNAIQKALIRDGQLVSDHMGAYVLMIALDLVPEDCKARFGEELVSLLEKDHGCLDTGFLATPFLLDAFTKIGRKDLAISLLWQTRQPSWLYEVEQGATAIWEAWDAILPEAEPNITSYDHYAFGCVDAWIFENVAGIRPLEPGFRRVEIRPETDVLPLDYCHRSFRCEYGDIVVSWDADTLEVSVPCGVTALVRWQGQEVSVGSGSYVFGKEFQNEGTR